MSKELSYTFNRHSQTKHGIETEDPYEAGAVESQICIACFERTNQIMTHGHENVHDLIIAY